MNESIDLKKRIIKMRENNDFIHSNVQSEIIKEDIKKEFKSEDIILENNKKLNFSNTKKLLVKDKNSQENLEQFQEVTERSNKQNIFNTTQTNEVQFRILANKFNEAVEVILELSDKVKKLEHTVYKSQKDTNNINSFFNYINIRMVFNLILIAMLILGIYKLPFDFLSIKLILSDIISSM